MREELPPLGGGLRFYDLPYHGSGRWNVALAVVSAANPTPVTVPCEAIGTVSVAGGAATPIRISGGVDSLAAVAGVATVGLVIIKLNL